LYLAAGGIVSAKFISCQGTFSNHHLLHHHLHKLNNSLLYTRSLEPDLIKRTHETVPAAVEFTTLKTPATSTIEREMEVEGEAAKDAIRSRHLIDTKVSRHHSRCHHNFVLLHRT
jgi:hypothetical protein